MSRFTRLMVVSLTLFAGCGSPPKTPYTVKLIRPDGVVMRTWTLRSIKELQVFTVFGGGGVTRLSSGGRTVPDIVAPSGWLLDVELSEESN